MLLSAPRTLSCADGVRNALPPVLRRAPEAIAARIGCDEGEGAPLTALPALSAGGIVLGSVFVHGLSCGYFTRLVVTDRRLLVLQGYEVCRRWGLDELPRSLLRYGGRGHEVWAPTVDLGAVTALLGGTSDRFADAKTILAFGKQLDRIKLRDDGRP